MQDHVPSIHATLQARFTAAGLRNFPFQKCFSSPIHRAQQCTQHIWAGRDAPIRYHSGLSEACLGWLQGMTNDYAAEHYADVYGAHECLRMGRDPVISYA